MNAETVFNLPLLRRSGNAVLQPILFQNIEKVAVFLVIADKFANVPDRNDAFDSYAKFPAKPLPTSAF